MRSSPGGRRRRPRPAGSVRRAAGIDFVRVWEHEVALDFDGVVGRIIRAGSGAADESAPCWRVFRVEELNKQERFERRLLVSLDAPDLHSIVEGRRDTRKWRRTPPPRMA